MEPPSASTSSPASGLDALDALEAQLLDILASGDFTKLEPLLERIARAEQEQPAQLYRQPPPIDPSEGRRSTAELRRVIAALLGEKPTETLSRSRAGYALDAAPGGEARVAPAFVAALGGHADLQNSFPDLWAIDAELWQALPTNNLAELTRLWLTSPGRRLVQDINALSRLPRALPLGASDLSFDRLKRAAGFGLDGVTRPPSWRAFQENQTAIPGGSHLTDWAPEPVDANEQVQRAFHLLEEGSPRFLRGAALAWLLNRAVEKPDFVVDGVRRDIRVELPSRLTEALRDWFGDSPSAVTARELETLALKHAARIVAQDSIKQAPQAGWCIARFLQASLRRSPFFGGDDEVLAAHLRARLPAEGVAVPEDADALHPARFSTDESGLDVTELAFIAGVVEHYIREPSLTLLPTPEAIVRVLQQLASRRVRRPEDDAERALAKEERNALGWPEDYPIAVPLAARCLLSVLRIGWIGKVSVDVQRESIDRFAEDPNRFAWLAFGLARDGHQLDPSVRSRAVDVFLSIANDSSILLEVRAMFGVGVVDGLDDEQTASVFDLAVGFEEPRPSVIDWLAVAAERLRRFALVTRAVDALIAWMADTSLGTSTRLTAALFALRRASASNSPDKGALLNKISSLATTSPFSEHLGLQRELRRMGLLSTNPGVAGLKR